MSPGQTLIHELRSRTTLPIIVAPMFRVSGPEMVIAACRNGVIGAFPTSNCRSPEELSDWLERIASALPLEGERPPAPVAANLIIRQARLADDLACLIRRPVSLVITSVGSPATVMRPLHDVGTRVFADVASVQHAQKAIDVGADGLVLLTAGAGGQTGWANPFAFISAIRPLFDGPIVLAGGMGNGSALFAAQIAGYDFGYMGTRFIATDESRASISYKQMVVSSTLDDVITTSAFTGLDANMLRPSIAAAGIDPEALSEYISTKNAEELFGANANVGMRRWSDIWSAGHCVGSVDEVASVGEVVARVSAEYQQAKLSCGCI